MWTSGNQQKVRLIQAVDFGVQIPQARGQAGNQGVGLGQLRIENAGEHVTLVGWMENVRVVGNNFAFIVLRDFYGTTQIVVETEEIMSQIKGINKEEALPHEVADEHPERERAEARVAHLLCLYAERLIGQQDAPEEKPSREHAGPGGKRQHLMGEQAGDPDDGERPVLSAERTGHYGVREHELPREGAERVHGLRRGAGPVPPPIPATMMAML